MVQYRRNRVPGGTYFFTVTLHDRKAKTLVEHIHALRVAFRHTLRQRPFRIDAIVVLPDHLHSVWTLPPGDVDYAGRWRAIKSRFTRELARAGIEISHNAKGEYDLWQRRYWEHTIRDEQDFARHVDYIHFNPVKHGLVKAVQEWPYSTFHHYVRQGLYPRNWGDDMSIGTEGNYAE